METDIDKTFLKLVKKSIFHAAIVFIRYSKQNKELCPLQNSCLTPMVIYEATLVNNSYN